ncbi:MAG: hypothetical protein ACD_79C00739G0015 [uncultured bacterium]|nr:MAG: hypothetical protein ACD_79C00739G0015 [uncultured bacterium]
MNFKYLVRNSRSIRQFDQNKAVDMGSLYNLIDIARLTPSAANLQPLKYYLSNSNLKNEKIFKCLKWAGYLKDWKGLVDGKKPAAYIVIVNDTKISKNPFIDCGIVAQTICLAACEKGLGTCMLGAIDKENLQKYLKLKKQYEIMLVIALGFPKDKVILENLKKSKDIKYWRDKHNVHHVPKRVLNEIIL